VRLNSLGAKLRGSDLALARIIAKMARLIGDLCHLHAERGDAERCGVLLGGDT
jgi:hypothetical protein